MRFLVFSLALLLAGCETTKLWQENSGEDFVEVGSTASDEDVEAALKQSGREYYCRDLYASTYPYNKVCYAKLTNKDKIKKIQVKLLNTPEKLAIDATHTILVVGYVALEILMQSGYHKG